MAEAAGASSPTRCCDAATTTMKLSVQANGAGKHAPRVKVSVAFQVGRAGDVLQRKKFLSFAASDSMLKVCHEISGRNGTAALWPRDFGEKVQVGFLVCLFVRLFIAPECGQLDDEWYFPEPQTRLLELVGQLSDDSRRDMSEVQMLFRLESHKGALQLSDSLRLMAVSYANAMTKRAASFTSGKGFALKDQHTFLDVVSDVDGVPLAQTRCYAKFDPSCSGTYGTLSTTAPATGQCQGQQQAPRARSASGAREASSVGGEVNAKLVVGEAELATPTLSTCIAVQSDDEESAVQHTSLTRPLGPGAGEESKYLLFHGVMKVLRDQVERLVLHRVVDIGAVDVKGNSVMHFWARSSVCQAHLRTMGEFLVNAGADVNAPRPIDGMTPLHHAIVCHNSRKGWWGFHKAVFLMRHGASVENVTASGQTPVDVLRMDSRVSTQFLLMCLRRATSQMSLAFPTCGKLGCEWCA